MAIQPNIKHSLSNIRKVIPVQNKYLGVNIKIIVVMRTRSVGLLTIRLLRFSGDVVAM